jgi:hypothetical protein
MPDTIISVSFISNRLPDTSTMINWVSLGLDLDFRKYYLSGFYSVQQLVDSFAFNYTSTNGGTSSPSSRYSLSSSAFKAFSEALFSKFPEASLFSRSDGTNLTEPANFSVCAPPTWAGVPFPTVAYSQNPFYLAVGYLFGLVLTMATLYPVSRLVKVLKLNYFWNHLIDKKNLNFFKDLVEEKETRMRETMGAMGMDLTMNSLAWWTTSVIMFTWLAVAMALIAKRRFKSPMYFQPP